MRLSRLLGPAPTPSDDPLVAAGCAHRLAPGLYSLLPLGHKVLGRVSERLRRAFASVGSQELAMPLLQPEALWTRPIGGGSRADAFGAQLLRIPARGLVLAPTHEEVAALLAATHPVGAEALPLIVHQIQPRFRDQLGDPEPGLLRTREFVMADAYSFHASRECQRATYAAVRAALTVAMAELGVSATWVRADGGPMNAESSEELLAPLPGASAVAGVSCPGCGDAASVDVAEAAPVEAPAGEPPPLEELPGDDPAEVAARLGLPASRLLAAIPFVAGRRCVLGLTSADQLLHPTKLERALAQAGVDARGLHRASAAELRDLGANFDWISLVRTPAEVLVVADRSLGGGYVYPAPRSGAILRSLTPGRDFRVDLTADLAAVDGGPCPRCGAPLQAIRGTEVAHVFSLGTTYSEAFGARLGDAPLEMGCYGVGATRAMAVIARQRARGESPESSGASGDGPPERGPRDPRGFTWPVAVSPFAAVVRGPGASGLYEALRRDGHDVLLDDRGDDRAERLGLPLALWPERGAIVVEDLATGARTPATHAEVAARLRSAEGSAG